MVQELKNENSKRGLVSSKNASGKMLEVVIVGLRNFGSPVTD